MSTFTDFRSGFRLGPWEVLPDRGLLRDGETEEHLEPKMVDVLVLLAAHSGQVVSKEQLIESVWDGRAQSDEPLTRCISGLRKVLRDDSRNPTFIETIPRRGYRLKMTTNVDSRPGRDASTTRWPYRLTWGVGVGVLVLVIIFFILRPPVGQESPLIEDSLLTSVAVFPFQCSGTTAKHLCFGFSEALISTLLHAEDLKIVKSRTPFPVRSSHQQVAQSLGVDGLLNGSVQRVGDEIRISAELVDGRNGFVILSDTLDGSVEDIFQLQEQLANIVSQSIGGDSGQSLHVASKPSSFEAFEAYARGQYQFEIRDQDSIAESIDLFQQAIRLDPKFGPAYLRLAQSYLLMPDYVPTSAQAMYALAAETANAGIKADPSITRPAGTVFGFIHHKRGEWLQATEAYEMAVTAKTVYPIAHHWYSRLLASVGRLDNALYQSRRAYELDPDSAIIISRLAISNLWVDELELAGRYFDVVSKMTLRAAIHEFAFALYLVRMGQIDSAIASTESALEQYGLNNEWVAVVFAGIENPELRQQSRKLLSKLDAENLLPRYLIMILWAKIGDTERTMQSAMAIENFGQEFALEMLFINELRSLRQHEDFPLLLEKTGLTEYWGKVGCEWIDDTVRCK